MADPRFFKVAGPFTLGEIAEITGAEPAEGAEPGRLFTDVAPLERAGAAEVSFLDNKRYIEQFAASRAGACIVSPDLSARAPEGMALLLTPRPYKAYALAARAFYPKPRLAAGQHPTALVGAGARIGEGTLLGPGVVVGANVEIGRDCVVKANAVIEDGVVVGDETEIGAGAFLSHCLIGKRCLIHAGVCIGNRGFGFAMEPEGFVDVPQLGRVIVEDDVEIGANSTIDRGAGPDTVIGAGSKIDNLVQIGHNVHLGRGCVLVAQAGIAGSTRLEDHVLVAAQAGVAGHLTIGTGAQLAAKCGVMRDVPPGQAVGGIPAVPVKEWFRHVAMLRRQAKGERHD